MGYLIKHIKSGRFILSDDLNVMNYEFGHLFTTRKQALNYMNEYKISKEEYTVIEEKQAAKASVERFGIVDDIFED